MPGFVSGMPVSRRIRRQAVLRPNGGPGLLLLLLRLFR